ncbi:hypothetical protein JCM10213_003496 [Rhodosporidiobolus nylandii]
MSTDSREQPRSGILSLPEEVLDLICEQSELAQFDDVPATLSAWSRTCRAFRSSGQRVLFRAPFMWSCLPTTSGALALAEALASNSRLRGYVRDLSALQRAVDDFLWDKEGARRKRALYSFEPEQWQQKMLELCPEARSLDVQVVNEEQAETIGGGLRNLNRLAELMVVFDGNFHGDRARSFSRLVSACAANGHPPLALRKLVLLLSHEGDAEPTAKPPSLAYSTANLSLSLGYTDPALASLFLPTDLRLLRTLEIDTDMVCSARAFEPFVARLAGNSLTTFYFSAGFDHAPPKTAEAYTPSYDGTAFPLSLFSLFPHIQHLSLRTGREMSLEKLRALACASPDLETLDLGETYWHFSLADFERASPSSLSVAESKLVTAVAPLLRLWELDLGILPVDMDQPARLPLEDVLESREVELSWEPCGTARSYESSESDSDTW